MPHLPLYLSHGPPPPPHRPPATLPHCTAKHCSAGCSTRLPLPFHARISLCSMGANPNLLSHAHPPRAPSSSWLPRFDSGQRFLSALEPRPPFAHFRSSPCSLCPLLPPLPLDPVAHPPLFSSAPAMRQPAMMMESAVAVRCRQSGT